MHSTIKCGGIKWLKIKWITWVDEPAHSLMCLESLFNLLLPWKILASIMDPFHILKNCHVCSEKGGMKLIKTCCRIKDEHVMGVNWSMITLGIKNCSMFTDDGQFYAFKLKTAKAPITCDITSIYPLCCLKYVFLLMWRKSLRKRFS